MANSESSRETDHAIRVELKIIEATDIFAFQDAFIVRVDNAEFRFGHAGMAQVSHAEHQTEPAIVGRDEKAVAENDAGGRPGEPDKDQASDDRDPDHAEEDLDRDNDMAINRCGIVMPVADGGQSFHTEEERVWERTGLEVGNAV